MEPILRDLSSETTVKAAIKSNWKNYHYCLGRCPSVELSIGRYLTWLVTSIPDHFINLVVCTQLPTEGSDELIASALAHFKSLNIKKLTWLAEEGIPAIQIKKYLMSHGLTFDESFGANMAADLMAGPEHLSFPNGLEIIRIEDPEKLRQWIHVASIGFGALEEYEDAWYEICAEAVFDQPFWTYLGMLDGQPVATSQLFLSAGVAGIYNVTSLPEVRGRGIGAAITQAPLLDARAIGYHVAILQASAMGYPVYRRLGFQDYGKLSVYLWENDANLLNL
jgi:GNAT superfamily N-acetyltransferase